MLRVQLLLKAINPKPDTLNPKPKPLKLYKL